MSISTLNWAFGPHPELKSPAKFVLVCLADMAGQDNRCWPSYDTIRERTRLTRNSIGAALTQLEQHGLIKRTGRFGSSNVYEIMAPNSTESDTINSTQSDTTVVRNPVHKPSINHQKEPPLLSECIAYAQEKNFVLDVEYFYEYYSTTDWKDVRGNPVKNWKNKMLQWNKREAKDANLANNGEDGRGASYWT